MCTFQIEHYYLQTMAAVSIDERVAVLEKKVASIEVQLSRDGSSDKTLDPRQVSLQTLQILVPGFKLIGGNLRPDLTKIAKSLIRLALLERLDDGSCVDGAVDSVCKLVGDSTMPWTTGIVPNPKPTETQAALAARKATEIHAIFERHGVLTEDWVMKIDFDALRKTEGSSGQLINALKDAIGDHFDLATCNIGLHLAELFIRTIDSKAPKSKANHAGQRVPLLHTAFGRAFYLRLPKATRDKLNQPIPIPADGIELPIIDAPAQSQ